MRKAIGKRINDCISGPGNHLSKATTAAYQSTAWLPVRHAKYDGNDGVFGHVLIPRTFHRGKPCFGLYLLVYCVISCFDLDKRMLADEM